MHAQRAVMLLMMLAHLLPLADARGEALQVRSDVTPVLLVMGGYWSCGQNSQNLNEWSPLSYETAAAPVLGPMIRASNLLRKKKYRQFGEVISCYSVDPGTIHYTSNLSGKNTLTKNYGLSSFDPKLFPGPVSGWAEFAQLTFPSGERAADSNPAGCVDH